jgi:hypothetical protein
MVSNADERHDAGAVPEDPLARVCDLLNREGARYVVVGAQACILHGLVRTTEDVDLLIEESTENYVRVIRALSNMADGAAAELTPADLAENVVIKVADEVEVDISRRAWTVDYAEAEQDALVVDIEGVRVPYASLPALIRSKSTYREQDRADRIRLETLLRRAIRQPHP